MPVISEREPVIELAKSHLCSGRSATRQAAALLALREHFHLAEEDGIWGSSEAAVCMGYFGRTDEDNLLQEIAADIATAMEPVADRPRG